MIIAGTGTRSIVTNPSTMKAGFQYLVRLMNMGKDKYGDDFSVISGMAEGFDELMAEAAIETETPWDAYIPNPGYANYYWRDHSQTGKNRLSEFNETVQFAKTIHYSAQTIYVKGQHSNFVRNEDMVNAADKMWVYDPTSRGTSHCVAYTKRMGKPFFVIPPFQT